MSESVKIIQQATLEAAQQKTTVAMVASSAATVATSTLDVISPYIPLIALASTILFGAVNVVINYKKYQLEKQKRNIS